MHGPLNVKFPLYTQKFPHSVLSYRTAIRTHGSWFTSDSSGTESENSSVNLGTRPQAWKPNLRVQFTPEVKSLLWRPHSTLLKGCGLYLDVEWPRHLGDHLLPSSAQLRMFRALPNPHDLQAQGLITHRHKFTFTVPLQVHT